MATYYNCLQFYFSHNCQNEAFKNKMQLQYEESLKQSEPLYGPCKRIQEMELRTDNNWYYLLDYDRPENLLNGRFSAIFHKGLQIVLLGFSFENTESISVNSIYLTKKS